MSGQPLLVHVGYHKTATTWLQTTLFRAENGFPQILSHAEVFQHFVSPHGLIFDPSPAADLINARQSRGGAGTTDVISLEALVGHPFYGGRESDDYGRRVKSIAPESRILITIREQSKMLASVYMQYVRQGGTLPPETFFEGEKVGGYFGFDPAHFEYDRLVSLYRELFGPENVFVLPIEVIARDQAEAVFRLARFSGNETLQKWHAKPSRGVSAPEPVAALLRRINHFRNGPAHRQPIIDLGRFADLAYRATEGAGRRLRIDRKPVTDLARARYGDRFIVSNRSLADLVDNRSDLTGYQGLDAENP